MARRRSIQHTAPKDEDVASMSLAARYVWAYLPCYADREGKLDDKPFYLKVEILPLDDVDMDGILDELALKKHIYRFTAKKDGRKYIHIRNFTKYQTPHKAEALSTIEDAPGFVRSITENNSMIQAPDLNEYDHSGPGLWSGSLVSGPGQYSEKNENIPFDENSWLVTLGVWESVGPWISDSGQRETFQGAKKLFIKQINASNWNKFIKGLDLLIDSYSKKDRKYLGTLYSVLHEEKWKDVTDPKVQAKQNEEVKSNVVYNWE